MPTEAKVELAEYFLGLGKHVLMEKPLLLASEDAARRLEELARRRGVACYTSYNHRFEPSVSSLKREFEAGSIGRLVYGNGTVGAVRGSWRENGPDVLEDLAPHLFDLGGFLLGRADVELAPVSRSRHEAACFDHAVMASRDGRLLLETRHVAWKNTFAIDLFGGRGSVHVDGLCKWAGSRLTVRERVYPSGVPTERVESWQGADPTWADDLAFFEGMMRQGGTTLGNDRWISRCIAAVSS